ncbi:hypothetical protein PHG31p160 [Aeromonas phage 31]|uniref:Uncharacterized protein n=3 Tax=Biquartavirus 44RR2 TaxID=115987 RepID=Q6U9E0_9CAUD|nr:hypothetical protein ST44RRORF162w [Aeromonas phage 44RR2.8t]YP_238889.1 hypothetical protein PHG31p160 [Aeromonas phage 31]APU00634.1 hypothetical protein [Aeromonas phage 44RR2.8t.2]APU01054.1 hypothetical protein [Aeromonas phage 31.2]APU01964.1 hypothetical protein [Aeromonas phage L9-6]APU02216.1 hypothetical protein [Aeromonas phage Riv-10]APU02462.1 hypothetical protein [Aeromonas phage SW69-9]
MILIKSSAPVISKTYEAANMSAMTCQLVIDGGDTGKVEIDGSLDGKSWINIAKLSAALNADGIATDGGIASTSWNFYRANLTETSGLATVIVSIS